MNHTSEISQSDGFTLVETIVAFVVLSLTLTVAVHSISASLVNTQRARVEMEIRNIARAILADTLPLRSGESGESGQWGESFRWRIDVKPLPASVAGVRMHVVTLEVRHENQPKMSTVFTTIEPMDPSPW